MPGLCSLIDGLLENTDSSLNDPQATRYYHAQVQRGTSPIVLEQVSQIGRSGRFQYFDFGARENVQEYGSEEPPVFPLDQLRVPIALLQGKLT